MINVLFICHGNICRSPMAEFLLKDMVSKMGIADQFEIASAGTSTEELGNPVHHGTRNKLEQYGISTKGKYARQLTRKDYAHYDYLIGLDEYNIRNIERITGKSGGKIHLLLDFAGEHRSVKDPWYTGDFDTTYDDIMIGLKGFLIHLGYTNVDT